MASIVTMPKLGNTAENTILVRWLKSVGEPIRAGEPLCEVETDKAMMEVPSTASGTILALLYRENDEVPVMVNIAVIGEVGEDISSISGLVAPNHDTAEASVIAAEGDGHNTTGASPIKISPRARKLAQRENLPLDTAAIMGSGPDGRIIERDVQAALATAVNGPKLTPVARAMLNSGNYTLSESSGSAEKRITKRDLIPVQDQQPDTVRPRLSAMQPTPEAVDDYETIPLTGTRKIIAARMLESMQTTAQLTLNTSANAVMLREYRSRLKQSSAELGLRDVTINDLILFAVSRTLPQFLDLNSLHHDGAIHRYNTTHLGMAVDTPRGLLVPVIRHAERLGLRTLADESHRLAEAASSARIQPDEMTGGTFTVTNLGHLGIESFTPILNPPQVAILGVGSIQLKPVESDSGVQFIPHLGLSLTINHQVIDGAPAARFLQALCQNLAQIDLLAAL